jgi:hypothetical protein
MKYFIFKRESKKFDDILKDVAIKKHLRTKIKFHDCLFIGMEKSDENLESYINLKFGDSMVNSLSKDHSPIPYVDYMPKEDLAKWKKV